MFSLNSVTNNQWWFQWRERSGVLAPLLDGLACPPTEILDLPLIILCFNPFYPRPLANGEFVFKA